MNIYLQGLTMGLAYVAPIGLQNLFVINSALTAKRPRALQTVLQLSSHDNVEKQRKERRNSRMLFNRISGKG